MTSDAAVRNFSCNLCEAMCGLRVTVEDNRVLEVRPNPDDVFSRGHICPKGPSLRELLDDPDRLRVPMRRTKAGWEKVGWDEALDEAAGRLRAIREAHGNDAVALYIGNPTAHSHRASLGSQLITQALSTRNRFDPNSQDSNPRLFACMEVYGDGLSLPVPDVDRTDFLLMLGANPAASNGSQMALGDVRGRLKGIRERGGKMVLVDPRRNETAAWCDAHHFIRPGGDAAFLLALLHVMFSEHLVDEDAVREVAGGLPELRRAALRYSPRRVAEAIEMKAETIVSLARQLCAARRSVIYGRIGTCQNEFGPVASWLIEAVNVVTGNFDREGGTMFPQPAADIGGLARLLVGNQYDRFRSRVRGLPEFLGSLPSAVMAEEMETPGEGQVRALFCFAGNPVLSTPNGARLSRALSKLEYMVAVDFYINESSRHANLVFPAQHVFESGNFDLLLLGLAVRNTVKYSPRIVEPPPGSLDDFEILAELSMRIALPDSPRLRSTVRKLLDGAPEKVLDLLLRAGRHGDHFLPGKAGLRLASIAAERNGIDLGPLVPARAEKVRTLDGKVRLAPERLMADLPRLDRWLDARATAVAQNLRSASIAPTAAKPPAAEKKTIAATETQIAAATAGAGGEDRSGQLLLIGRRHLRSNNSWMHNLRSLVKGPDRAQLLMHPDDASRLGLAHGARVTVRSRVGEVGARLSVSDEIMRGVVSLPHGYGHGAAASTQAIAGALPGESVNALTDELLIEPVLGTSILNGVPVSVTPER